MEQPNHLTLDRPEQPARTQTEDPEQPELDVHVEEVDASDRDDWNDIATRSPHGLVCHQYEFLETIARHVDAELYTLVGRVGDEPVGIFPFFRWRPAKLFDVVFSPPPKMGLYLLGPAVLEDGRPTRVEKRTHQFVTRCLDRLQEDHAPWYVHVQTSYRYGDVRPFNWHAFDVTPRFTYLVDLDRDEDNVFMSFSSDARRNVRRCREADVDCHVEVGGAEEIRNIVARVNDRYAEQGESFSLDPALVVDLYERLPDGQVLPYTSTIDGEFAGGMIAFEYGETIYRWQGGVIPDASLPINDYLDWQIMRDAMHRNVLSYDLVGANTERLCEYKAKFDPTLARYYSLTGGKTLMRSGVRFFNGSAHSLKSTLSL